ncbi:MAG: hypothetical protein HZA58_04940 [Acidimicrobiia bacterium]|nr:hypothetical protein [Acidimicrobiia bacterium]
MEIVIAAVVAVVVIGLVLVSARRRQPTGAAGQEPVPVASSRMRPAVAEFHVVGSSARVHFEVPLPSSGADGVLAELLGREAVEVVREKRHTLPLGDLTQVVALGRHGTEWVEVATIGLKTPGELPPPMIPELLPHSGHREFNPFARLADLPETGPGGAGGTVGERLEGLVLRLPVRAQAAVRSQGIDPSAGNAPAVVLALMRSAGYQVSEAAPGTFGATRGGERTFIRVVGHRPGEYPELDESVVRTFIADFASSGMDRGLLLSEKWAPFEIHERERRDARVRFITRERIQSFADVLALG